MIELNYKLYGQGDPVIILHGLFGSLDNWASFGKNLGAQYMTFLVDQRDHGKSPHTDAFNYNLLAQDVNEFMEENWIHSGNIIGHSMGGKTAMMLALKYPDMVDKLVVLDMAPKQYTNRHTAVFDAMKAVDLEQLESRQDATTILLKMLDGDRATAGFLLKNIRRNKDGSFSWKMNVELLRQDYENIVAPMPQDLQFEGETLFIRGSESSYILDDDMDLISQMFPNSQLKTLENAGHWVHADQPEDLLEMVEEFLK